MARKQMTYVYPGFGSTELAQALGNKPHNTQIRIIGTFGSRRAFIDAAMETGLLHASNALAAARYLAAYGYQHEPLEREGMEPGEIYLQGDMSQDKPTKYADLKAKGLVP